MTHKSRGPAAPCLWQGVLSWGAAAPLIHAHRHGSSQHRSDTDGIQQTEKGKGPGAPRGEGNSSEAPKAQGWPPEGSSAGEEPGGHPGRRDPCCPRRQTGCAAARQRAPWG